MNYLSIAAVSLFLLMSLCGPARGSGAVSHTDSTISASIDTVQAKPDPTPYETTRSFGEHMLAFPSYLFHWITRPAGWAIKFGERKFPSLFRGERGKTGIFPLFETGGETGAAYGALFFHRDFTSFHHKIRAEILFGSEEFNDFDLEYTLPGPFSKPDELEFQGTYYNDPLEALYGANDSELDNERRFWTEEARGDIVYSSPLGRQSGMRVQATFRNVTIRQSKFRRDDGPFIPFPDRLKGEFNELRLGTQFEIDFTKGVPRNYLGPRFLAGLGYNESVGEQDFRYLDYHFEWQQFVPMPFLPNTRRLAFRSQVRKVAPLTGEDIPFYNRPSLGSSRDLRGYRGDRFRDDGSLLLTLEYRYPIWDFADLVLFADEGQVFHDFSDIALDRFHGNYGFGFHALGGKGLAFRLEFAFSKEGQRFILSISPNF
ncbi:MAG: BamA/TamA family outer membrane protein [Balneolaceae bacterium]|nr:BamA/TamA family outer membrane protein [Balneolaceae bacterium]